ncbi:MAG TPA: electron transfer flavoprotein subunit alpha, partial [Promineifilum sp.]|nr:electron transfer flavoprotein subunit alpha [Promineifilum sp.]
MSGVWVYVENRDGAISAISREALGAARQVADGLGQPLTALVFGQGVGPVCAAAFDLGADAVVGADDATLADGRLEAHGPLVVKLAQERQPAVILIGASTRGRDLAAWTAADLDTGAVADAIDIKVEGGVVKATRPVYT